MSGEGSAEGGGWELVGRALVAVRGGARWCRLVVVVRRSSPVVVRSLSFVLVRRSFVLRRWRLASLVWGEVQWTALAVHCHWEVDGGRVALARRVAIDEGDTYPFIE